MYKFFSFFLTHTIYFGINNEINKCDMPYEIVTGVKRINFEQMIASDMTEIRH